MTIVPHALGGAAAAILTDNYYIAFLFGLISHFILDMIPHLEPNFLVRREPDGSKRWSIWLYVFLLIEIGMMTVFFFFLRHRPDFGIILIGILAGLLPDVIVNNPFLQFLRFKPFTKYLFWFHDKIHLDLPIKYWYVSLACETLVLGGSIWLILTTQ